MSKQLKAEIERLWKHVQELKDKLMAEQKINLELKEQNKKLKDALKDKSNEHG
jgi:DNA anti-recombination protein RmuC